LLLTDSRCWDRTKGDKHETLRFICLYFPIIIIIIFNTICYVLITRQLNRDKKRIESVFENRATETTPYGYSSSESSSSSSSSSSSAASATATWHVRQLVLALSTYLMPKQILRMAMANETQGKDDHWLHHKSMDPMESKHHCDTFCWFLYCVGSVPSSIVPSTSLIRRSQSIGSTFCAQYLCHYKGMLLAGEERESERERERESVCVCWSALPHILLLLYQPNALGKILERHCLWRK
jgi:hypothetical protein